MFEDEGQEEMGENTLHTMTDLILYTGVAAHLASRPEFSKYRVFSNLNLMYHPIKRRAYVSPDLMVVVPARKLRDNLRSYRVGATGPAPRLTAEILSERSYQQQDFWNKPKIYADLGVREYMLIDMSGEFLPEFFLMKRLVRGAWKDERDADGGITSRFGFRLIVDGDGQLRVVDAGTGRRYVRPDEAEAEAAARQAEAAARQAEAAARMTAEQRVRELEAELAQLRPGPTPRRRNHT